MKNIYKIDVTSFCQNLPKQVKRVFECVLGDPEEFWCYCSYWERIVTCEPLGYQFDYTEDTPVEVIEQFEMDWIGASTFCGTTDHPLGVIKDAPVKEWGSLPDEGTVSCQIDISGEEYEDKQDLIEDFFANGG